MIAVASLARCIVAFCIGLGNDEVYYRMYAQVLHWNYFDHPPMVAWLIRLTTANLLLDYPFFIRLGAILSAAATTWMFFLCGKKLSNERAGFLAALLYTGTLYGSIIAGTFILPDSPQMIFWVAGLYLLIGITGEESINAKQKYQILLFGLVTGAGMLCKIHSVFLWLGFLMCIFLYRREWLKQPVLYLSLLVSAALFYPVIQWNIDHHFVTYFYHEHRVNGVTNGFNVRSFAIFVVGQVLYFNPVLFPAIVAVVGTAFRNELSLPPSQKDMLLYSSLPLIGVVSVVSCFHDTFPHWTGPAYSGLILLASVKIDRQKLPVPPYVKAAVALIVVVAIAGLFVINGFPGTLGNSGKPDFGAGDFTLDMYGWNHLKTEFGKLVADDRQAALMKPDAAIISNKWFSASHIDYYVAMPLGMRLIAIGEINDIHQYVWLNEERRPLKPGDDAYCIASSDCFFDVKVLYAHLFQAILPPSLITQYRCGKPCRIFYVYRLKSYMSK